MPERPKYVIDSIDNALRALDYISDRHAVRVYELAAHLGIARSSAHRLLATLEHRGFVTHTPHTTAYRPGSALTQIALRSIRRQDLRLAAHDEMTRLSQELAETLHIITLEGNGARFIDGIEGTITPAVDVKIGILLPAHATAGGKVLLAQLDAKQLRDVFPRIIPGLTDSTLTDRDAIAEHLRAVARNGFATNREESAVGVAAVAVPIQLSRTRAPAALTLSAPVERFPAAREPFLVKRLQQSSVAIARTLLGHRTD